MQNPPPPPPPTGEAPKTEKKRGNNLVFLIVIIAIVFAVCTLILMMPMLQEDNMDLKDPGNDVLVSQGQSAPGMLDVTGALFNSSGEQGNLTIRLRQETASMQSSEAVYHEVNLILEDQGQLVNMYILYITIDSTGTHAEMENVIEGETYEVQISAENNMLNAVIAMPELVECDALEWNISSIYERYVGNDLIGSAFDFAPDQGTHITELSTPEPE